MDGNTIIPSLVNLPSDLDHYKSLPEFLVNKANHYAKLGKDYFEIDAVSREKRHFAKFDEETKRIASSLHKLGLRMGDVVIFMPSDMIKLHIFLVGVWRANAICRASYPEDDAETLRSRIVEGECKFIMCDPNGIKTCKEALKGISWNVEVILPDKHAEFRSIQKFLDEDDGLDCPPLNVGLEDPALILSTSGTTGPPKGAVITHARLMYTIYHYSLYPFTESKPNLLFSKGTHASGSTFPFSFLITGKTCITTGKISNEIILKTVHELKPGFAFAFPTFLLVLVSEEASDYDMTSLEVLWSGGTIITPAMRNALLQLPNVKDFIVGYGLTESMIGTTSAILFPTGEAKSIRDLPDFSVGKPLTESYIQVRDLETLQVLGPHQVGEICCKNPGNFKEYYKNPEATQKVFIDGFVRTGDVGYYDENGYVFIKDRVKEIFKYYNNHISPSELEGIVGKHPSVNEVCVVGIPDPAGGGDIPRAFITVKGNPPTTITEEIQKFTNDQLPDYKHIRGGVFIVSELPKGKTGKVARNLVAKLKPICNT